MKKLEIINLYQVLGTMGKLVGAKFAYAVAKNLNILEQEITALDKALKMSEGYKAYDSARVELAKKHSKKDEKGEPEVVTDPKTGMTQFVILDMETFDKEVEELKKDHKDALEEREKQIRDYKELLETESRVELYKVNLEDVPKEISVEQMAQIYQIVE